MLALAPLTFAVFGGLSLAGLAVNLVAIPLVSFVLVPLVLAGALAVFVAPALSHACFGIAAASLRRVLAGARLGGGPRVRAVERQTRHCGGFRSRCWRRWCCCGAWPPAMRVSAACALLPLVFAPSRVPEPGAARINVLDAGRGTAALVFTHSHVLLFDTGDSWNTRGARLRRWVLPALDALQREPRRPAGAARARWRSCAGRRVVGVRTRGPGASWSVEAGRQPRCQFAGAPIRSFAGTGCCSRASPQARAGTTASLRVSVGAHAILLGGDLDAAGGTRTGGARRARCARERRGAHQPAGEFDGIGARVDRSERRGTGDRDRRYREFTFPRRDARALARFGSHGPRYTASRRYRARFRDVGRARGRRGSRLALSLRLAALAMTLSRAPSGMIPAHVGTRSGRRPIHGADHHLLDRCRRYSSRTSLDAAAKARAARGAHQEAFRSSPRAARSARSSSTRSRRTRRWGACWPRRWPIAIAVAKS